MKSDGSEIDEEIQVQKVNNHQSKDGKAKIQVQKVNNHQSKDEKAKKMGDGDLDRTVFINNLPFDATKEEVIEKFSLFGKVELFLPVLHKVTKSALIPLSVFLFCLKKGFCTRFITMPLQQYASRLLFDLY
jgi:RNA recognition motif-containing protein